MTNFDIFKENLDVYWVADAIENQLNCDDCPAYDKCTLSYDDEDDRVVNCQSTIVAWLETVVDEK